MAKKKKSSYASYYRYNCDYNGGENVEITFSVLAECMLVTVELSDPVCIDTSAYVYFPSVLAEPSVSDTQC